MAKVPGLLWENVVMAYCLRAIMDRGMALTNFRRILNAMKRVYEIHMKPMTLREKETKFWKRGEGPDLMEFEQNDRAAKNDVASPHEQEG